MTCISKYLEESVTSRSSIVEQWGKMVQGMWMKEEENAFKKTFKKRSFKKRSFKRSFKKVRQEVLPDGTRARTRTRRVYLKSSVPRDLETG
jgi:hypothetical protein